MKLLNIKNIVYGLLMMAAACGGPAEVRGNIPGKVTTEQMDWAAFLSRHDMHWNKLTEDPAAVRLLRLPFVKALLPDG